jgi:hypothetical protein
MKSKKKLSFPRRRESRKPLYFIRTITAILLQLRDISLAGAREIGLMPFSMKNAMLWAQALPPK